MSTIDPEVAYRAVSGRDPRYDGRIYLGVTSTGVYCRPSCPARTPRPENCRYFRTAAAAVAAGYRACRRCRPDALPGSRDWDARADLTARALRAIEHGVVDEVGVDGLAADLHVSTRHLTRQITAEIGVGPGLLARSRRTQLARHLLDQTDLPMASVAFAAGFASVRQFNDVVRDAFGATPSALRAARRRPVAAGTGREPVGGARVTLHLQHRPPLDAVAWYQHVARRAVPGLERAEVTEELHVQRLVAGRGGPVQVVVRLDPEGRRVDADLVLADLADLGGTVARLRRWLDLDADPAVVDPALAQDPALAPLVAARPGLRVPGTVDGGELALRAVLGQQVSVEAARTLTARLVAEHGVAGSDGLTLFPEPAALAAAGPDRLRTIGLTGGRARSLHTLAGALAAGLRIDPAQDREHVAATLLALPGVGEWTAQYVALRAMADPDAFPAGDLVLRRAVGAVTGAAEVPVRAEVQRTSARWRPWRAYAAQHLWTAAATAGPSPAAGPAGA